jgi:hypothetical protein
MKMSRQLLSKSAIFFIFAYFSQFWFGVGPGWRASIYSLLVIVQWE